ncbi:peroxidase 20 isoform X1 [Amborella trichopoda]|uniref:peroxidase 20 isoform X1 n=1 Tax=Amborella trichopoda TaxID=13333 RepID=UPI0009BE4F2F|nr:peroxidase 20 isoform X1 [Amborella trichopoda]|eukprot:XP_020524801.1 peroxidase 20 isoform X1 [Amborella trichopoda]
MARLWRLNSLSCASVSILVFVLLLNAMDVSCDDYLVPGYYRDSCPLVEDIVRRHVLMAIRKDPRMAASLLRLHFHDCFVMGCDGSVLLDSRGSIESEKGADPNVNSVKGFEVVDSIKFALEIACPAIVSCADILAMAARDSVVLRGGPNWDVYLGRRDSLTASFSGANKFIPLPNSTLQTLITNFQAQGLDPLDLVTLSGSHTIGYSRCLNFRQHIYSPLEQDEEEYAEGSTPDYCSQQKKRKSKPDPVFRRILRSTCPITGRDNSLTPLDYSTSVFFDNHYFLNLMQGKALLQSDSSLLSSTYTKELVWAYASNPRLFYRKFASSMVKMGNINPLIGDQGEIRQNCRFVNSQSLTSP